MTYSKAATWLDATFYSTAEEHISEVASDKVGHDHSKHQREYGEDGGTGHYRGHHLGPGRHDNGMEVNMNYLLSSAGATKLPATHIH